MNSTKLKRPIALVVGSGAVDVSDEHINTLVASLRAFINGEGGSTMTLHGYKPPYRTEAAPDGFMEFWVSVPGQQDVAFSIEFGGETVERCGFEGLSRRTLEEVAKNADPINLQASVANFDELWKFTCQFAEQAGIGKVHLRYGV